MFTLPLLVSLSHADVLSPPPAGEDYAQHNVRIEGLAEHPDFVVVAFDGEPGGTIGHYASFTATGPEQQALANGSSRGGGLGHPGFYLMAKPAYDAWSQATSQEIFRQRAACERGEGCAHISRFSPSYPSPTELVSCDLAIDLVTTVPAGQPTTRMDAYRLSTASAEACVLDKVDAAKASASPEGEPTPSLEPSAPDPAELPPEARECSAVSTSAASVLGGLLLVVLAGRRRRRS